MATQRIQMPAKSDVIEGYNTDFYRALSARNLPLVGMVRDAWSVFEKGAGVLRDANADLGEVGIALHNMYATALVLQGVPGEYETAHAYFGVMKAAIQDSPHFPD